MTAPFSSFIMNFVMIFKGEIYLGNTFHFNYTDLFDLAYVIRIEQNVHYFVSEMCYYNIAEIPNLQLTKFYYIQYIIQYK